MFINPSLVTSDKGGGKCICPCLSVCLLARLLKNACMDLDEMLHVTGVTTNWVTFKPDPDYSRNAGTGLLSTLSYMQCYVEFYVGENPTYTYLALQQSLVLKWFYGPLLQRHVVVQWFYIYIYISLFSEPLEHLCRRYMSSIKCPSSLSMKSKTLSFCWSTTAIVMWTNKVANVSLFNFFVYVLFLCTVHSRQCHH